MSLIKFIGLVFLLIVFYSLGKRASEISPPVPQPIYQQGASAESWTMSTDPPYIPYSAFSSQQPSQIQTQQQTVNVYPSVPSSYDSYNYWLTSPSYGLALRNAGTQRPPPIRRNH